MKSIRLILFLFVSLCCKTKVIGQEVKTYTIQQGAIPWFDRPNFSVSGLPPKLLSDEPIPQQSCGDRSIVLTSKFSSITLGVNERDLSLFQKLFPSAKATGESFTIMASNSTTTYPYKVFVLDNPPTKIKDAFVAGLILLKAEGINKGTAITEMPVSKPVEIKSEKSFKVQQGAIPWYDRPTLSFGTLTKSLMGNDDLPQQNCSSRGLVIDGNPKSIILGVNNRDSALFLKTYSSAKSLKDSFTIISNTGITFPYTAYWFPNPPVSIKAAFQAGLILLKIDRGTVNTTNKQTATTNQFPTPIVTTTPFELVDKTKFKLYLLMGQSNMVGRDTRDLAAQTTDVRIGYLNAKTGRWQVAIEPMHVGGNGIGPGISFAQNMLKSNPKVKIGLIPTAVGGTPLSRWVKGGDLYENAVKMAKIAMFDGTLAGVLWHQGETDSKLAEDANTYKERLTQMFIDLRKDLGMSNLPIVVGQLGDFVKEANIETVKAAISSMSTALPNVAYADSKDLVDKGDKLHFDTKSQQIFGGRYAAAMLSLKPNGK